jgi:iron complex transport system ATP-binding protein
MDLRIENLNIGYSEKTVLQDINLQINHNEIIMLIGKNGSGKSTLLKTIAGIIPKISGNIYLNNKPLQSYTGQERSKLISIVLTDNIEVNLSVYEFLRMGRQAYTNRLDLLSGHDKNIIEKYIEKLSLNDFVNRSINTLSDGERQKVLIARALIQETPVLLLDEPATHLDMENKAMLFNLLFEIKKEEHKIIIFSSHDINLLAEKIDNFWLANKNSVFEINQKNKTGIQQMFTTHLLTYDNHCKVFKLV